MIVNPLTVLALVLSLAVAGYSVYRDRRRPSMLTREEQLEERAKQLESTVQTLLTDRNNAQKQIDALRAELEEAKAHIRQLEAELARYSSTAPAAEPAIRPILLVGVGSDPKLAIDLAMLRRERNRQALRISRLMPVTKAGLERILERHRKEGHPIRFVHLSVHSGPQGLAFDDGMADGLWLSQTLQDVEILVLNGCMNEEVADLLAVVPWVVSMREEVEMRDAAIFADLFWSAVADGKGAEESFEVAIKRGPPVVSEFADLHG